MKRLSSALAILSCIALLGAGCGPSKDTSTSTGTDTSATPRGDVNQDICAFFTPDFVHSATGRTIVRVEPSKIAGVFACRYFLDYSEDFFLLPDGSTMPGGPNIDIVLDNLNVEKQKTGLTALGARIGTDSRVDMEHYVVRREKDDSVWEVALVINPNRFVWVSTLNEGHLTDEEVIGLAAKMADLIQGRSTLRIEKNPIDLSAPEADTSPTQEGAVRSFFDAIGGKDIEGALAMMDADDGTKAGWRQNFGQLASLKVVAVEPTFQEEWTAERQTYKTELDVKLQSGDEAMGWTNGRNFRWVTMQKVGDLWKVHELANNP
ncbi:MAG: hypothetical protein V1745_01635 [Patescibacteria group bacterium]